MWGCAVLVIDEAQDLDPEMLEQLRLLLNFETDEAKLLQIVLVGHPELNQTLRHHAPQLDERVARRCELHPLSDAEIAPYIDHRLSMAQQLSRLSEVTIFDADDGMCQPLVSGITFTKAAIGVIATQSRGIPRAINVLCDRALEIAQERGVTRIDWRILRAATRRVQARSRRKPGLRTVTKAAMAAAAVMLLAMLGFGVRSWGIDRPEASPPPPFARVDSYLMISKSLDVKALPAADSFNIRVASFRTAGSAAALAEQLLNVAVAQRIAQVPRDGLQDQRCLEVAAFEVVLGSVPQLLGNCTQDHGPPPDDRATKSAVGLTSRQYRKFATGPIISAPAGYQFFWPPSARL